MIASSTLLKSSCGTWSTGAASVMGSGVSDIAGGVDISLLIGGSGAMSSIGAGVSTLGAGSGADESIAGALEKLDTGAGSLAGDIFEFVSGCTIGAGASDFLLPKSFAQKLCFCSGWGVCDVESIILTRYQI